MSTEAQKKAQRKYDVVHKNDYRRYNLKLYFKYDADIIKRLEQVDSMQGYIKELIRKDIEQGG